MIEDVERMQIRYLDDSAAWKEQWPDSVAYGGDETTGLLELPELPKAVEVTIEHKTYGTLVWLFQLPS